MENARFVDHVIGKRVDIHRNPWISIATFMYLRGDPEIKRKILALVVKNCVFLYIFPPHRLPQHGALLAATDLVQERVAAAHLAAVFCPIEYILF